MENLSSGKEIIRYLNTDCSPSHLPNNISISKNHIFYIHNSENQPRVIMVDKNILKETETSSDVISKQVAKLNNNETSEMLRVKVMDLNGTIISVVGLYGGLKVYSYEGTRLFYNIPCKIKLDDKPYAFQAISEYYNFGNNLPTENPKLNKSICHGVLCADSYGQIFLIIGVGFNFKSRLLYTYTGITAMDIACDYKTGVFACGFETGEIFIFKINDENSVDNLIKFDNIDNLPCISLTAISSDKKDFFAGGFLNGEIKLYSNKNTTNKKSFDYVCSIYSNLRMINSLNSYRNYIVSCADDCFINIWKINENDEVSIVCNLEISDKMPIAAEFTINQNGKLDLIATCFDSPYLTIIENLSLD